jgi:flagellar motility protein MotE (MotC chaperone)
MNSVLRTAHSIPVVGKLVPAPKAKTDDKQQGKSGAGASGKTKDDQIAALNSKIADLEASLKKADEANQQKDQTIKDLQSKNSELDEKLKTKTQTEEEYTKQIQQLAAMYAKMDPGKAAPIIENLSPKEQILLFSMMKPDDQSKILQKMDPKKAAEASIGLKDVTLVKDKEIAALQERLEIQGGTNGKSGPKLTKDDVGQTFANMTPKSAAAVLVEMYGSNSDRVVSILSSMDTASRSRVLSAISDASKDTAASISSKLAANAN